jgi:hypothetical protein
LARASEKYELTARLQKRGYVSAVQLEHERIQLDILREELATQIRLLELEADSAALIVESAKNDLARIKKLVEQEIVAESVIPPVQAKSLKAALRFEKIKQLLKLYQKVRENYVPQDDDKKSTPTYVPQDDDKKSTPTGAASYGNPQARKAIEAADVTSPAPQEQIEQLTKRNEALTLRIRQIKEIEKAIDTASGEAKETLIREALKRYEELYREHRSESLGLWSRFYQGRLLWSLGRIDEAEKIFEELTDHPASLASSDARSKQIQQLRERILEVKKSEGESP